MALVIDGYRRWSKFAVAAVVAVAVLGCGSGSNETVVPTEEGASDFGVVEVPARFGTFAITASDRLAVGVVDQPYSTEETSTLIAVDLDDGGVDEFSGPLDEGAPVAVEFLATDGAILAGAGERCNLPSGGEGCGGSLVVVRLDPDTLQWTVIHAPEDATGLLDGVHVVDGDIVLVLSEAGSTTVRRLSSDGTWSVIADLPAESRSATCVADGAVWLFRVDQSDSTDIGATDTSYRLTRLGLDDGEIQEVDLPDLAGYFGGVTVPFGCNGAGPLVATTPPGEVPSPDAGRDALSAALTGTTAWNYHEEGWQAVETQALDGATAAGQIISGPRGAVIRAAEMTESSGPNRPIAIAAWPSGRATEIETTGDDTFLWRGNKDQMIWVYDTEISSALTVIEVEP